MLLRLLLVLCSLVFSAYVQAGMRPDAHAPIGVMGDHAHKAGEWMFSYRYMFMDMDGNRDGKTRLNPEDILRPNGEYGVTPLQMDMTMQMLGTMYAPNDKWTLMLMLPYIELDMNHRTAMGMEFITESSGLGDVKLGGIYSLAGSETEGRWLLNVGLSVPTGSIDEEDFLPPIGREDQLPFPMQIGSGTYDFRPGITYRRLADGYSVGAQAMAVLRLGDNDNGYTLGDRFNLTTWLAKPLSHHFSASVRLQYQWWDHIDGLDQHAALPISNMMGRTVPTVDPELRGGESLDIALGLNTTLGANHDRVAFEVVYPIEQDLNGPQLETDITLTLGYQKAF